MSTLDRTDTLALNKAAEWLRTQAEPPRLAVPALQAMFGLSAKQACEAIAIARQTATSSEEESA